MNHQITILKCPTCGAGLPHIHEELVKCCYCGNISLIKFEKKSMNSYSSSFNYLPSLSYAGGDYQSSSQPNHNYCPMYEAKKRQVEEKKKEPELNMALFAAGIAAIGVPIISYD